MATVKQIAKAAGTSEQFALEVLSKTMKTPAWVLKRVGVSMVDSATYLVKEAKNRKKYL